jgi:hypothetical protein
LGVTGASSEVLFAGAFGVPPEIDPAFGSTLTKGEGTLSVIVVGIRRLEEEDIKYRTAKPYFFI